MYKMAAGRYLIILLVGYILASCTKEVTIIDIPGEGEKENSRISFQISLGSENTTRSGWTYDSYFPSAIPTPKERKVSNVLVVIFKNIVLEEYVMYEGEGEDFTLNDNTITLHKTDEEEDEIDLEPGMHYFYVLLNIPDRLYQEIKPQLENGKFSLTKETFEKQLMRVDFGYLTGETTGDNGFVMTNRTPPAPTTIYSKNQCDELGLDNANKITINAGRALAKVSLAYIPAKTGELHGSLENIEYKTVNHPSVMHLMPVIENGTLLTPHYNNTVTTGFLYPAKDAKDDERPWLKATTVTASGNFDFDYCIENNVKRHLKSNSTGLLIRGKFIPTVWLNKDGSVGEEKEDGDGTFWRILQYDKDGYFLTYTKGYYNEEPEQLPGTDFKAVRYPGGICYYTFWLTTGEEHLVKRNDFHKVVITHLHGAGAPDPGDLIEPDVDPDPIPTWGRLAVFAMGWDDYPLIQIIGKEPDGDSDSEAGVSVPGWEEDRQENKLEEGDDNKFK